MSDQVEVTRPPIEPIYSQTEPNQPINLGRVAIQLDFQDTARQETASVTMSFVPDERLHFIVPCDTKDPLFGLKLLRDPNRDAKFTLTDRGVTFDALLVAAGGDEGLVFLPKRSAIMVTPPSTTISSATFHLFNFPNFYGPEDYVLQWNGPSSSGSRRCGAVVLKADGWTITIAATDRTDDLEKRLKAQGGYVITHMGRIARQDGTEFTSEQLDDLLNCLRYFLSFVTGRWAGVALPIGFDSKENRVFEQWGMGKVAGGPWNGSYSCFDLHHGELLSQVLPGFVSLWKNALWHQPLTHAIYWYLGACDRGVGIGVDTGLILAQTALELLAWTHCVEDCKMISAAAFKPRGLSAADKLRLLASSLGIPKEIPPTQSALHGTPGKKWGDGMDAITGIRNALVHPNIQTELPDNSYYEGWKLSLWYVDLVFLRLCGHNGKYANRLVPNRFVGAVESVPWAEKE